MSVATIWHGDICSGEFGSVGDVRRPLIDAKCASKYEKESESTSARVSRLDLISNNDAAGWLVISQNFVFPSVAFQCQFSPAWIGQIGEKALFFLSLLLIKGVLIVTDDHHKC
jgi:hypothetical protein